MVSEVARICGRVGFVLGVTSYLGRAWWDLELHGVTKQDQRDIWAFNKR